VAQADESAVVAGLAITLLAPMPPLLFMGEEWGSARPFPFFCDFQGELAQAVREGRHREFADAYAQFGDRIPDPLAEETFHSAVLDWDALGAPAARRRLALVKDLLAVRRSEIVPRLSGAHFGQGRHEGGVLIVHWTLGDSSELALLANLGAQYAQAPGDAPGGRPLWNGEPPQRLPPWSVYWTIGAS